MITYTMNGFLCGLFLLLASCYSFNGISLSPELKTVTIKTFPNNAQLVQPTISQSFTEALKDKFSQQTKLTLVNNNADLVFEGAIIGYTTQPIAIQGNEVAAMNRLTVTISVKFTNRKDDKQSFETSFSRYQDYPSSPALNSSKEEELIKQIDDALVEDIFNKAVVNW
jgi:outer membrane lipopolysaccharide assembly protein LptE/RlpB